MPVLETVFFWFFAFGAVVTSGAVIAFRNPLYSAIALILDFFFFAGLYVLLSAHFIAVTQVLVYGGAIMVLFIFIIMLLNLREAELGASRLRAHHILAVAVGLAFFGFSLLATDQLVNHEEVESKREAAAEMQAELEAQAADDEEPQRVRIQTPSEVPQLYGDLNEAGLQYQYERQLAGLQAGTYDPSARKYPRFDPDKKFETPPVLAGKSARGGPLDEPVSWGTVEPISILLVNRFVVPFELTALLLLAAIVGAVIVAKKRL
jgi:NADH:ubiquinone oxidoreductase subunit 6 (subunit J)